MASPPTPAAIAAKLVVGLAGSWPAPAEEAWLRCWRPAGVILFSRNVSSFPQLRNLCRKLHELLPGLEICADHEGGPVSQLAAAVGRPPAAWGLGILGDVDLTRRVHAETGRRLRLAGVDRVLAPCADVLTEPRNPVIGARAFGPEVEAVSGQVAAAVGGLQSEGVACCLKHWPGHGASGVDTHLVAGTAQDAAGARPFAAGLAAGADAVMVGHLSRGAAGPPATLDRPRLEEWRRLWNGSAPRPVLLFADDVTMGGLRPAMSELGIRAADGADEGLVDPAALPLAWLQALAEAGNDRLLIRGIPWAALPLAADSTAAPGPEGLPVGSAPAWPEEPYGEAQRRLLARLAPSFFDRSLTLGWLDLTVGDRWEVAGGDPAQLRDDFTARLRARFARVVACDREQPLAGAEPLTRLLVTSHRPVPASWLHSAGTPNPWAKAGLCLVLGHPSLAPDLKLRLGPEWVVSSWYEVDWTFLARFFPDPV